MRSIPEHSGAESGGLPPEGALLDGKYRVGATIGRGGMAMVIEARHLGLDERVALKVLLPEFREDPNVVERFLREGRAATKIRSEHVVRIRDVAIADGCPYLVMEYLDGVDLQVLLAKDGPLATTLAVDYLLQACEAIAEAHAAGIVHRDLKPANLFLTHRADGSPCVKVLDFGISKTGAGVPNTSGLASHATLANTVMGSPHYMSPEQMESAADADARSDIWSLGTILYELVAGRSAFEGDSITELCVKIIKGSPTPLAELRGDVPLALDAVVFRCLEKAPQQRYSDVADLASALAGFGTGAAHASALRIARVIGGGGKGPRLHPDGSAGRWLASRELPPADAPRARSQRVGWALVALVAFGAAGIAIHGVGQRGGAPIAVKALESPSPPQIAVAPSASGPEASPSSSAKRRAVTTPPSARATGASGVRASSPSPHRSASVPAAQESEPEPPIFAPPPAAVTSTPYADNPFAGRASGVGVAPAEPSSAAEDAGP